VANLLRGLGAALGFVVGAGWLLIALAVPLDELGECCQGVSEDLFAVGVGVWGLAGGYWTLFLAWQAVSVVRGRPASVRIGRHAAFLAVVAFLWLLCLFGVAAGDW
jgi:hypothetical protein